MIHLAGRHLSSVLLLGLVLAGGLRAAGRAGREEKCSAWVSRAVEALEAEIGSRALIAYRHEYVSALESLDPQRTTWDEVESRLKRSRRVLLGDQHDRGEFQELAIEVMEQMDQDGEKPALVIEFIQERFQPVLDRWLAREIGDAELKKKAYEPSAWGFPWRSYRAVLARARDMGWRVVAVEASGRESLARRDQRIAAAVSKLEGRVLIFYGSYHLLGKQHLADRIDPDLVITPVAEERYWPILRAVGGKPRAVRLGDEVVFVNLASALDLNLPYLQNLMKGLGIETLEDLSIDHPDVGDCPCEEAQ